MADRPILFSDPMVRALLNGRKTQTRRVIDFPGIEKVVEFVRVGFDKDTGIAFFEMLDETGKHHYRPGGKHLQTPHWSPRYSVGDRLWVREAWQTSAAYDDLSPSSLGGEEPVRYAADGSHQTWGYPAITKVGRFRQGMHLPRWASRLTLTVTDVCVQRLHDISEADAVAEGCFKGKATGRVFASPAAMHLDGDEWDSARDWYADLWDSLNEKRGYGWDTNPWVVVVNFILERLNIDEPREVPFR